MDEAIRLLHRMKKGSGRLLVGTDCLERHIRQPSPRLSRRAVAAWDFRGSDHPASFGQRTSDGHVEPSPSAHGSICQRTRVLGLRPRRKQSARPNGPIGWRLAPNRCEQSVNNLLPTTRNHWVQRHHPERREQSENNFLPIPGINGVPVVSNNPIGGSGHNLANGSSPASSRCSSPPLPSARVRVYPKVVDRRGEPLSERSCPAREVCAGWGPSRVRSTPRVGGNTSTVHPTADDTQPGCRYESSSGPGTAIGCSRLDGFVRDGSARRTRASHSAMRVRRRGSVNPGRIP